MPFGTSVWRTRSAAKCRHKGRTEDPSGGDVVLTTHQTTHKKQDFETFYDGIGWHWGEFGNATTTVDAYKVGTRVVDGMWLWPNSTASSRGIDSLSAWDKTSEVSAGSEFAVLIGLQLFVNDGRRPTARGCYALAPEWSQSSGLAKSLTSHMIRGCRAERKRFLLKSICKPL